MELVFVEVGADVGLQFGGAGERLKAHDITQLGRNSAERLGISKTDAEAQYLAYHEGRTGYANQSYLDKPWLVEVAAEVGARATLYDSQLAYCR